VQIVAGGVASCFGAGLFTGLAPAASLTGPWLLAAFAAAAGIGYLAVLSTVERPLAGLPKSLWRIGFALDTLGRLAAAVAIAGTFGAYLLPERPAFGGLVLVVVVTAAAVVGLPAVVTRVAALVVVAVLAIVVAACFAIAPEAPAVATPDGGSVLGVLAAVGLLTVCLRGAESWVVGDAGVRPGYGATGDSPAGSGRTEAGPAPASGAGGEVDGEDAPAAPGPGRRVGPGGVEAGGGPVPGGCGDTGVGSMLGADTTAGGESRPGGGSVGGLRLWLGVVVGVVAVLGLAVAGAVLRQLGAPRLAVSPVPLRDALAAADAVALEPLLLVGVGVGCGFALLGVLRGLGVAGVPRVRVLGVAAVLTCVGCVFVPPGAAVVIAAVLLLGDAGFRFVAVRHRGSG
jgi:basic amino acid/polyamine antiporter, APA family